MGEATVGIHGNSFKMANDSPVTLYPLFYIQSMSFSPRDDTWQHLPPD
jgi:hypothetical protein